MNTCLVELLQPDLSNILIPFTPEILLQCEKNAAKYNVQLLFYVQLKRYVMQHGDHVVIDGFLQKRKSYILKLVASTLPNRAAEQQVLQLLARECIAVVVLKGSAIAQEIYKNVNSRISCDVDLLIKESEIDIVDKILLRNGYERMDREPLCFLRVRRHHTVYLLKDSRQQILIEVHWSFSIPGLFKLSSVQIWDQVEASQNGTFMLLPQMVFISLLMHNHMHAFKQFRNVLDLYWGLYEYGEKVDWSELARQVDSIGLRKITRIGLNQIEELWSESCNEQIGYQRLHRDIGQRKNKIMLRMISSLIKLDPHAETLEFKDKIIYRLALDHWNVVLFSFYKSVFPERRIIKELFEDRKSWGLLMNYFRYWRWRFF